MLLLLAADASAQGQNRPMRGRHMDGGGPQRMLPAQQRDEAAGRNDMAPGGGRLTPEERRQLRRDVHEAGRDLYPERERLRRRERLGQ
jgi:hypothetical protein